MQGIAAVRADDPDSPGRKQLTRTAPARILDSMYESRHAPLATQKQFIRRLARHFGGAMLLIGGSLLVGVLGYRAFEGMAWIDAFLNAAMLLGGMGPVPPELHTQSGKVFAGLFALYSGLVVLAAASILIAPVFHRIIHRFHLEDESKRRMK